MEKLTQSEDKIYKTPEYTRRAIKAYKERNKNNQNFIEKHRKAALSYYYKKKAKKSLNSNECIKDASIDILEQLSVLNLDSDN